MQVSSLTWSLGKVNESEKAYNSPHILHDWRTLGGNVSLVQRQMEQAHKKREHLRVLFLLTYRFLLSHYLKPRPSLLRRTHI